MHLCTPGFTNQNIVITSYFIKSDSLWVFRLAKTDLQLNRKQTKRPDPAFNQSITINDALPTEVKTNECTSSKQKLKMYYSLKMRQEAI